MKKVIFVKQTRYAVDRQPGRDNGIVGWVLRFHRDESGHTYVTELMTGSHGFATLADKSKAVLFKDRDFAQFVSQFWKLYEVTPPKVVRRVKKKK